MAVVVGLLVVLTGACAPGDIERAARSAGDVAGSDGDKGGEGGGKAANATGIGDGTHRVGKDIKPGTYRSSGSGMCYWARLKGFSGELDDVAANGNNAPEILTLTKKDKGLETQGCGEWVAVKQTAPKRPAASFGDGTYQVGVHIKPGTYRSNGDEMCYWARFKDFTHDLNGIGANGNNAGIVEIARSDAGFTTFGCGEWERV